MLAIAAWILAAAPAGGDEPGRPFMDWASDRPMTSRFETSPRWLPTPADLGREEWLRLDLAGDLVEAIRTPGPDGFLLNVLDGLFGLPEPLFDAAVGAGIELVRDDPNRSEARTREGSVLERVAVLEIGDSSGRKFQDLAEAWVRAEQRWAADFGGSTLNTIGFELGLEDLDRDELMEDQFRVAVDAFRTAYFSKYVRRVDARARDEIDNVGRWSGWDLLLGPPVVVGYAWLRGFERRFPLAGPVEMRVGIQPFRRMLAVAGDEGEHLVGAFALEIGVRGFPLKGIVSFGWIDGAAGLDFVGIGTSMGEGRRAVKMQLPDEGPDRLW